MSPVRRAVHTLAAAIAMVAPLPVVAVAAPPQTQFDLVDNRIMILVAIDGRPGFSMVFDTGSSGLLLTPDAARRMHVTRRSAGTISGAGRARVAASTTHVTSVTIAGIEFGPMKAVVADLGPIRRSIGFRRLDGIVGYDLLLRYAVEVDADRRIFALWRQTYPVPVEARRVRYTVSHNFITIPARIDSVAGSVILDTGDRSSLTLFRPFARDYGFHSIEPSVHGAVTGYGIGGPILADVFRTQLAAFGYTVNGVLTRAPVGTGGAFDTSSGAGSIGNAFMLRFNVVYDLPRQTLVLWPSRQFATEERYDPVGMWIAASAGGPIVTAVLARGSADRAGVRIGDTVLAVNGISTKTWFPPRLRDWLAGRRAGTTVMMLVQSRAGNVGVRNVLIQPPI